MATVLHSVVVGPLEPFAQGFAGYLAQQGYSVTGADNQLALIAHLSRWMADRDVSVSGLTPSTAADYVRYRRAQGYYGYRTARSLAPLLEYLCDVGISPVADTVANRDASSILRQQFRDYLVRERGLRPDTARGYLDGVTGFIDHCVREDSDLQAVSAATVTGFLVSESRRLSPKSMQRSATALRALLRYWSVRGVISASLAGAVPKMSNRSRGLARGLPPGKVEAMLGTCDRRQPVGLRDYAILTLLARVGLRAGEVSALRLDDIHWRSGEIVVTGKGTQVERVPLPVDAGEAIVEYLRRGRPPDAVDRRLFIRCTAPHRGLVRSAVSQIVATAARQAGLGTVHAHRLRHTAATSMLAAGASLTEIGELLRHRSLQSTAVYAKVDVASLRGLVRPWPTGGPS
ncbi:site-specific integrase [Nocardia abscessus]|uniref:site-specific integrase n=1 Tax=Nocardia abscessus TaxID=120957 RepID=UPI002455C7EE|nr:site-specific integrase [Nocardia abscessus]